MKNKNNKELTKNSRQTNNRTHRQISKISLYTVTFFLELLVTDRYKFRNSIEVFFERKRTIAPTSEQTTPEIRQLIIKLLGEGKIARTIGKIVGPSHITVYNVIKRHKKIFKFPIGAELLNGKNLTIIMSGVF